jgi:hypothetical protein
MRWLSIIVASAMMTGPLVAKPPTIFIHRSDVAGADVAQATVTLWFTPSKASELAPKAPNGFHLDLRFLGPIDGGHLASFSSRALVLTFNDPRAAALFAEALMEGHKAVRSSPIQT